MSFQGTLDSVSLADILQTLAMNRQTGTLDVRWEDQRRLIYFRDGAIVMADAPPTSTGEPVLISLLERRGHIDSRTAEELIKRHDRSGQDVRELAATHSGVPEADLDQVCSMWIEERVYGMFEWPGGNFAFTDGDPIPAFNQVPVIGMGERPVQTPHVVMEATRRQDEWARIREILPDLGELLVVDNEGRANLGDIESDPEMVKVLRYLDGSNTIDRIASRTALARFDVAAIVAQLVSAGVARPLSVEEVTHKGMEARDAGRVSEGISLLENAYSKMPMPEIAEPLADLCVQAHDVPRAVELYLELVQRSQDDGNFTRALEFLDKVGELSPDDPEVHLDRADVLFELDRTEDASKALLQAASTYLDHKQFDPAVDSCHRARDLTPRSPEPHRLLAKAYLQNKQSDNALVEYKALWHALLANNRPRKALSMLTAIVERDCKFSNIREQVLNHARGSEAVKTSNAARMLIYVVLLLVLATAGFMGWNWYQDHVIAEQGREKLEDLRTDFAQASTQDLSAILAQANTLRGQYGSDIDERLSTLIEKVSQRMEVEAQRVTETIEQALAGKEYERAESQLAILTGHLAQTNVAGNEMASLRHQLADALLHKRLAGELDAIRRDWEKDRWQEAVARLQEILQNQELTTSVRQELASLRAEWQAELNDAEALFRRAERILANSGRSAGLEAFRLAAGGEGDRYRNRARQEIARLEGAYAQELREQILKASSLRNDPQVFDLLSQLEQLVKEAESQQPQVVIDQLAVPVLIQVAHPAIELTLIDRRGRRTAITAPEGTDGAWSHEVPIGLNEELTLLAQRSGFSDRRMPIALSERTTAWSVNLERGPLWRANVEGIPVTTPKVGGQAVLVGTNRNTAGVIDPATGTVNTIPLPDQLTGFTGEPFLYRNTAYLVLGDRLHAVDLKSRSEVWSWPPPGSNRGLGGAVWVQEHELIQGQLQIFAPNSSGGIATLAVDESYEVDAYPPTPLEWPPSAPLLAHNVDGLQSSLYVPAGNHMVVFDITAASPSSPLSERYRLETRGDITLRPQVASVQGQTAILVIDGAGACLAIDADPRRQQVAAEPIASWPLEARPVAAPMVIGKRLAVLPLDNGRVVGLDLTKPGTIAWTHPQQGALGSFAGPAALGEHGLYVADGNGILTCLDPDTGTRRWQVDLGSSASTGVTAHDGRLFLGLRSGEVLCFAEGSP